MTTSTTPIVFIDTETDGLHPGRRVWEVAMIRRDDTGEKEKRFFVGIDLKHADPFGLKIGGFWDRHPAGRKISGKEPIPGPPAVVYSRHEAAGEIMKWTFGALLVGVNPGFDTECVAPLLRAEGYMAAWHYHPVDVASMAYGYLAHRGIPVELPWKSDDLAIACGVVPPSEPERHTALGDVRWTKRWYDVITAPAMPVPFVLNEAAL